LPPVPISEAEKDEFLSGGSGLPFLLRPGAKALVIGPGGGSDIVRALVSGSRDVTGVEVNPIIANTIMRDRFPDISGGLYFRPEVHIVVGDGRSFIRRNEESYDLLKVAQSSTWGSAAAGSYALSENSLFTTEAFGSYLSHLTPHGVMVFTNWSFQPPRESLRVVTLAMDALAALGEFDYGHHFVVVREREDPHAQETVLVSRSPFQEADISRVRELVARDTDLEAVYVPGGTAENPFTALLTSSSVEEYLSEYPHNVRPVDDNRPFFFYTAQARDLFSFLRNSSSGDGNPTVNHAVQMLFRLVGVSLLATAIVLTLPPLFLGSRLPKNPGVVRFLWYFVFIGVGYILIQVALIQKFVIFLEHPTYALTVIIFSMLVSTGTGSLYSRQFVGMSDRSLLGVLATVALLVALLAVLIPPLTTSGAGWPLLLKIPLTVMLLAPAGFVMGMAFPAGLARLEEIHPPSLRWAWSLNAAASVLGSATGLFLSIHLGLRETLLVGGVMYLCALVSVGTPKPSSTSVAAEG
jgi:spermidine synthase